MPGYFLFLLDCILVGLKAVCGLSLLAFAFAFVVLVPWALYVEVSDVARAIQRRRKAATTRWP